MKYFEEPGRNNIDETLKLAEMRALDLGIKNVVVASTKGFTAEKALEVFKDDDVTLTIVGIEREKFDQDLRGRLEEKGHNVCFSKEVSYDFSESYKLAYRRFCEGIKVSVEIPVIAAEEGFVPTDEEVVSIGKWDTAIVVKPAKSDNFSDLRVKELICMPR